MVSCYLQHVLNQVSPVLAHYFFLQAQKLRSDQQQYNLLIYLEVIITHNR